MRSTLVLLLALLAAVSAQARIGETPPELAHRYGDGHREKAVGASGIDLIRYGRAGFDVEVTFADGLSVREVYRRRGRQLTDEEISQLIRGMKGHGFFWSFHRSKKLWISGDGKVHAYRDPEHLDDFCVERVGAPVVHAGEDYFPPTKAPATPPPLPKYVKKKSP
jgi:hypothetical protein